MNEDIKIHLLLNSLGFYIFEEDSLNLATLIIFF